MKSAKKLFLSTSFFLTACLFVAGNFSAIRTVASDFANVQFDPNSPLTMRKSGGAIANGLVGVESGVIANSGEVIIMPGPSGTDMTSVLDIAFRSGARVELMPGTYLVSKSITCKNTAVHAITGTSRWGGAVTSAVANIKASENFSGNAVVIADGQCSIDGLGIEASKDSNVGYDAVQITLNSNKLKNLLITGGRNNIRCVEGSANYLSDNILYNSVSHGVLWLGCMDDRFRNNTVGPSGGDNFHYTGSDITISGNFFQQSKGSGVYLDGSGGLGKAANLVVLNHNTFQSNLESNLVLNGVLNSNISGNIFLSAGMCVECGRLNKADQSHVSFEGLVSDNVSFGSNTYVALPGPNRVTKPGPDFSYGIEPGTPAPTNTQFYETAKAQVKGVFKDARSEQILKPMIH